MIRPGMIRPGMIRGAPRSLGGIIALAGIGFALLVGLLGGATMWFVHEEMERQLDQRIEHESEALRAAGTVRGIPGVLEAVRAREAARAADDLDYIVLDASGRRVGGRLDAAVPAEGYTEFMPFRSEDGVEGFAHGLNMPIAGGGRLIVAAQRAEVRRMDRLIASLFGGAAVLIIVAAFGLAALFRRIVNRRLATISGTAEAIVGGDFSRRMPMIGDAEFDQVSTVINAMLNRIEALLGNLRQVSSDLAHDIRAPLNRVRGSLEALERAGGDAATRAAVGEIDDLLDLLQGLLGIAEIEGAAVRRRFVALDLSDLVADIVSAYRPDIEAAGMVLNFRGGAAIISGDPALLRRSIANLLDNILLHAAGTRQVDVSVMQKGDMAVVIVADDGPGIPARDLDNVLQRFVRLDRSRATPGHGLGLSMVAAIAGAHRGTVRLSERSPGLEVRIAIPLAA